MKIFITIGITLFCLCSLLSAEDLKETIKQKQELQAIKVQVSEHKEDKEYFKLSLKIENNSSEVMYIFQCGYPFLTIHDLSVKRKSDKVELPLTICGKYFKNTPVTFPSRSREAIETGKTLEIIIDICRLFDMSERTEYLISGEVWLSGKQTGISKIKIEETAFSLKEECVPLVKFPDHIQYTGTPFVISPREKMDKKYELSYLEGCLLTDYKLEKNLPEEIKKREIAYTEYWLKKAVMTEFVPTDISDKIQFVSGLWGKDEGTIVDYESGGYKFKIINSRVLILQIEGKDLKERDIWWCFKNFINCNTLMRSAGLVIVEQKSIINSLHGVANFDIKRLRNWFKNPVEWYKNHKGVIFIFQKEAFPPAGNIRIDPFRIKDGFLLSSPDAYKCFERDFKKAIEEAAAIAGKSRIDDSVIKGRPILRSPKN